MAMIDDILITDQHVDMAALRGYLAAREVVSVTDPEFGALGNGVADDLAAIQAACDHAGAADEPRIILFPVPTEAYAISGPIVIKNSNTHLVGLGGNVPLLYIGIGGDAAPLIRADKDTDHRRGSPLAAENYHDCIIENFLLNGALTALYGLNLKGWTRGCQVNNLRITGCVNPIRIVEGYYSSGSHITALSPPTAAPAGMSGATYAANLYGLYADECHDMCYDRIDFSDFGASSGNDYQAVVFLRDSEGASIKLLNFQDCLQATGRYVSKFIDLQGSTTLHFESKYWENIQAGDEVIRWQDNSQSVITNLRMNNVIAPVFAQGEEWTPSVLMSVFGEALDFSDRLFKLSSGTAFRSLRLLGGTSFLAGELSGSIFDGNTNDTAKYGFACDPIRLDNGGDSRGTGHVKRGYDVSIVGLDLRITGGEAVINGQPVQMMRHGGLDQSLRLDLTHNGTWDVMISCAGNVYAQKQSAPLAGSGDAFRRATVITDGDNTAPHTLTLYDAPSERHPGEQRYALPGNAKINAVMRGSLPLTSGAAATIATATFAAANDKQDFVTFNVKVDYYDELAAELSVKTARFRATCSQDSSQNRVENIEAVSEIGTLDAGLASMSLASGHSWATNVFSLQVTATNGDGRAMVGLVTVEVIGGLQSETALALGGGVTPAV